MRIFKYIAFIALPALLSAQAISWTDISAQQNLPTTISLFAGNRLNPPLKAWYLDVDLNDSTYVILPYLSTVGSEGLVPFANRVGAVAAINGGFFNVTSGASVSSVVIREDVLAQNISTLVRNGVNYPVTRAFVSFDNNGMPAIDWIYHFGSLFSDLYRFPSPTQNSPGNPAPVPIPADGSNFGPLRGGLGGGPVLVKDAMANISFNEEVFWESGIGLNTDNPRTAVGFTADNHMILFVADGRQTASDGLTLIALADVMVNLGCVEAMNLDGGGSSQLAATGTLINRPEGGNFQRPIPTILAIIHRDSLPDPPTVGFEDIIDTGDSRAALLGGGWFASANPGFYGTTPSELNSTGSGAQTAVFKPNLGFADSLEVYAWWVSAGNRSTDTPVVIAHQNATDTIRVDQSTNGSAWNYIGKFPFSGDSSDAIIISNAASTGSFVVADAIRLVGVMPPTGITVNTNFAVPQIAFLNQNYPNPFNPSTTISWRLQQKAAVSIYIVDVLGQTVRTIFQASQPAGLYNASWDGRNESGSELGSGIYFIRMEANSTSGRLLSSKKALLIR
ncbi:MAG: phosphodiester glycosidase family protein [Calditrichia bacterium]